MNKTIFINLLIACAAAISVSACQKNEAQVVDAKFPSKEALVSHFETMQKAKESESPYEKLILNNTSFKVLYITEHNDTAKALAEVTLPDISDVMLAIKELAEAGKPQEEIEAVIIQKYNNGEIKKLTTEQEFQLVKEGEDWKVIGNLAEEEQDEPLQQENSGEDDEAQ